MRVRLGIVPMLGKRAMVFSFAVTSLLILTFLSPVAAQEPYDRIQFGCQIQGSGTVVWGRFVWPGGDPVLGDIKESEGRYCENFRHSAMSLSGRSNSLSEPFIYHPSSDYSTTSYSFDEGSVRLVGTLTAHWIHSGENYMMHVNLVSTEETDGGHLNGTVGSIHIVHSLWVGTPSPLYPDPKIVPLGFYGICKSSDGSEEISGKGYFFVTEWKISGSEETFERVHWNLWIEELDTYVSFLWSSSDYILHYDPVPTGSVGPWECLATVPAAQVYNTRVRLA